MQKAVWSLGIVGNFSLGGLQASFLRTKGGIIEDRGIPIFVPYSQCLQEALEKRRRRQHGDPELGSEIQAWIVQVAKMAQIKNFRRPDLVSFSGFEELVGGAEHVRWARRTAEILSEQLQCPVMYHFHIGSFSEGKNCVWRAAYFEEILRCATFQNKNLSSYSETAVVVFEDITEVYRYRLDERKEWVATRIWPGLCLAEEYSERIFQTADVDGQMALRGVLQVPLLAQWIKKAQRIRAASERENHSFREYVRMTIEDLIPLDVLATLHALAAQRLVEFLGNELDVRSLILLGRGAQNMFLQTWLSRSFRLFFAKDLMWDETVSPSEICAYNAVRCLYGQPAVLGRGSVGDVVGIQGELFDPQRIFAKAVAQQAGGLDHDCVKLVGE